MSALDDLFDGHYFTEDPHVYIPIDEAQQELADLRNRIAELEAENLKFRKFISHTQVCPWCGGPGQYCPEEKQLLGGKK